MSAAKRADDAWVQMPDFKMKPYYQDSSSTLYHGDALEILPSLARVDAVVTDPPFAFAGGISNGRNSQASSQFFEHWLMDLFRAFSAVSQLSAPWFLWADWRSVACYERAVAQSRVGRAVNQVLIHDREKFGMGTPFRNSADWVCYMAGEKDGVADRTGRSQANVIRHEWYFGNHPNHDAEKSVSFAERIVRWASEPGAIVLDAFAGSGTTLLAAKHSGRKAVGVELEERHCETAANRLAQMMALETVGI